MRREQREWNEKRENKNIFAPFTQVVYFTLGPRLGMVTSSHFPQKTIKKHSEILRKRLGVLITSQNTVSLA